MANTLIFVLLAVSFSGCALVPSWEPGIDGTVFSREHRDQIKTCYKASLQKNPEASGKVVLDFSVLPSGQVAEASLTESTFEDETPQCVLSCLKSWTFPVLEPGETTNVVYYPLYFSTLGEGISIVHDYY